jgi:hypothetical protein
VLAAILAVYVLARFGPRALVRFVIGALPALVLLGAYDQATFGSPFHLSYRYVANKFGEAQRHGFFGIGEPTLHGLWLALGSERGLLVVSPVLVAALAGLIAMARGGRLAEAAVCFTAAIGFLIVDAGYFDPYGGTSPGPRFFTPALPFLALGLVEAFRRAPRLTGLLALASIMLVAVDTLTWEGIQTLTPPIAAETIWSRRLDLPRTLGIGLEFAAVAAAAALAAGALVRARRPAV